MTWRIFQQSSASSASTLWKYSITHVRDSHNACYFVPGYLGNLSVYCPGKIFASARSTSQPSWLLYNNPVAVKCNLIFQSLNSVLECQRCGEECFVSWISQLVPCPGVTHDQLTLILAQHKHWSWSAWDTVHFETWCGHSQNQILYWQHMNWMFMLESSNMPKTEKKIFKINIATYK